MEKEIIETVLIEILDEQKQTNLLIENNNKLLQNFDEKLKKQQDIHKDAILIRLNSIMEQLSTHSKPVKKEFRILLFPEQGTVNYYKVVFGRIFFWLVILCITKYAYLLGDKWVSKSLEINKYQRAWETYYLKQNKKGQKAMEEILKEPLNNQ